MARTSPIYYIAPSAISITPNANGSADDLAVYVSREAKIKVYSPRAGIGMEDGASQEWTISGKNRRLSESDKPYTIYARLQKSGDKVGYITFAQKMENNGVWQDKYVAVTQDGGGNYQDYYYIRLGDVSLPVNGAREVNVDTGILGTEDFNSNWALNPDAVPLRIDLTSTIDGADAGPTPYVYWGKTLILTATLVEGWTSTDIQRFDHWEIIRDTGSEQADAAWAATVNAGVFRTTGSVSLVHGRGSGNTDDFNSVVNAKFIVNAMENTGTQEAPVYEVLKSASIDIMAETWETYGLLSSADMVTYNPQTGTYSPNTGIDVKVLATDQKSETFLLTKKQVTDAGLVVEYATVGVSPEVWTAVTFPGADNVVAIGNIPTSAFAQQSINVRLRNGANVELFRTTFAFLRDGEDSKEREWIFLRSATAITFGNASSAHPKPSVVSGGQVNPSGAATGSDTNKNQDGWVPQGWWDDQQGTDSTNRFEYGSYRDYVKESGSTPAHWGSFTDPVLWNHYGKDGENGDDGLSAATLVIPVQLISIPTDSTGKAKSAFNQTYRVTLKVGEEQGVFSDYSVSGVPTGVTVNLNAVTVGGFITAVDVQIQVPQNNTTFPSTLTLSCTGVVSDGVSRSVTGTIVLVAQKDGTNGGNTATVMLYKRSSGTISSVGISATLYYKFADKTLYTDSSCTTPATTQLNGWSKTIPTDSTNPIYVTSAIAYSADVKDDIASNEWVTPAKFTENGVNGKDAQYIYLKGTARDEDQSVAATIEREVNVNGGTNLVVSQTRGLNLVTINRQTLALVESINYDTWGEAKGESGATGITDLITKLNALDNSVFVCLVSYDAIGWSAALISKLQEFGMGDLPYTATGRYPFLFIGHKDLNKGDGLMRMHDIGTYTDVVELSVYVANGALSSRDGQDGVNGSNGEDAVNVVVAPSSIIVQQDINNKNNIAHSATNNLGQFSIQVLKGATACTITSITASASQVYMSESASSGQYTGDNCRTWNPSSTLANAYLKGIAQDGNNYYTTGQITLSITYTDPSTSTSKTITGIIIKAYVNLVGTWSEQVEGDMKTELAQSSLFEIDNDPTSPTYGQVVETENWGEFKRSSTENISTLQQTVGDPENPTSGTLVYRTSQIEQTVGKISLKVSETKLGNITPDPIFKTSAFTTVNTVTNITSYISTVENTGGTANLVSPWQSDGGRILMIGITANTRSTNFQIYASNRTPSVGRIKLQAGKKYTFTVYMKVVGGDDCIDTRVAVVRMYTAASGGSVSTIAVTPADKTDEKAGEFEAYSKTFTVESGHEYYEWQPYFYAVKGKSGYYVAYAGAKLEIGEVATGMSYDYTKDVESGLSATGIDIVHRKILVTSDQFSIQNNENQPSLDVNEYGDIAVYGAVNTQTKVITASNYGKYMFSVLGLSRYAFNLLHLGNIIWLDESLTYDDPDSPFHGNLRVVLPGGISYDSGTSSHGVAVGDDVYFTKPSDVRQLLGRKIYIYNFTDETAYIYYFGTGYGNDPTVQQTRDLQLPPLCIACFEMKTKPYTWGNLGPEIMYWDAYGSGEICPDP